jgi:hypothetical protein
MVDPAQRSQLIRQATLSASVNRAAKRQETIESVRLRAQSTPGQLRLARTLLILVAFIIAMTAMSSARKQTKYAKQYASSSSEAVLNSYRLFDAAAGMDAFAAKSVASSSLIFAADDDDAVDANEKLNEAVAALLEKRAGTNTGFEERREKLAQRILTAAVDTNDSVANKERQKPLLTLQLGTADYLLSLKQAEGGLALGGVGSEDFAAKKYLSAADTFDESIVLSISKLISVSRGSHDNQVKNFTIMSTNTRRRTVFGGFAFLALVGLLKVFLFRRTNRLLNLPLVIVCALTVMYFLYSAALVNTGNRRMESAQSEFDRLVSQRLVRASGYQASSLQSRQLLPGADVKQLELTFLEDIKTIEQEDYFAVSLTEVHQRIRNLDRDNHAEAVLLAKTDTTFDKFLEQNQQRIDGLKKDFDRNAKSLSTNMSSFAKVSWLYFFITSALIILGLRPRIREFF